MNNNFIFIGRICKDLELRYTKENKAVCEVNIAVQNGKDDTSFIPVKLFGKIAETTHQYCHKGDMVGVNGIVKNHSWEDQQGNRHYDYSFIGNKVSFLQSKSNNQSEQKVAETEKRMATDEQIYADFGDSIEISDEDIAF